MLAPGNLLKSLSNSNGTKEVKDFNDDHDFSKVLEFCGSDTEPKHIIRYANSQEEFSSFDD